MLFLKSSKQSINKLNNGQINRNSQNKEKTVLSTIALLLIEHYTNLRAFAAANW